MSKQKMTPSEVIQNRLNTLTGEILTIIEAVVEPVEQDIVSASGGYYGSATISGTSYEPINRQNTKREAVKSLIRSAFSRAHEDMQKWIA